MLAHRLIIDKPPKRPHALIQPPQISHGPPTLSRPGAPRAVQDHFSAAEAYKWKKHELIRELQSFEHDTGSMPVRIGLLTQRIQYLTRHTQDHRKDHHGRRGLLILLSRRRKSLRVLRRKDFDAYVKVWRSPSPCLQSGCSLSQRPCALKPCCSVLRAQGVVVACALLLLAF